MTTNTRRTNSYERWSVHDILTDVILGRNVEEKTNKTSKSLIVEASYLHLEDLKQSKSDE